MSSAFFLCPYKNAPVETPIVGRYVAMDDHTPEVVVAGGDWSEAEIDGNQAIVRVRATDAILNSLSLLYPQLGETEARAAHTSTRRKASIDQDSRQVVFKDDQLAQTKPLEALIQEVPERAPSIELKQLLGLWLGIGFGLGQFAYRIPYWLALTLATTVGEPTAFWRAALKIIFDNHGAFPTTGVLDNFNRADEAPLSAGGTWTTPIFTGVDSLRLVSNACRPVAGGAYSDGYRNNADYGPDVEAFVTITAFSAIDSLIYVFNRLVNIGSGTIDGYYARFDTASGAENGRIFRLDNDAGTQLGATDTSITLAAGDKMGIESIGSTIGFYHNTGGTWTQIFTRSDATYGAAGKIGHAIFDALDATTTDDFGGGTVVAGGSTVSILRGLTKSGLIKGRLIT